jgi:hypothetical protein
MNPIFIFPSESAAWEEKDGLGGLTRFGQRSGFWDFGACEDGRSNDRRGTASPARLVVPHISRFEAVTKLVPSAKADSVCSTFVFPALTCRAIGCRRYAAVAGFVPPSPCSVEFRNDLGFRDVGADSTPRYFGLPAKAPPLPLFLKNVSTPPTSASQEAKALWPLTSDNYHFTVILKVIRSSSIGA